MLSVKAMIRNHNVFSADMGTALLGVTAACLNVAWSSLLIRFSYGLLKSDPDVSHDPKTIRTLFQKVAMRFTER